MKSRKKLPEFRGKPLIEVPEVIPTANFLVGDFGKAVLKEYQGRVKADYNNDVLDVLDFNSDNIVTGSNPFAVVLMNQILRQKGLRTATPADLEKALKSEDLDLSQSYEDTALVLRSEDHPNRNLAIELAKQIRERQKLIFPVMIPLTGLELDCTNFSYHVSDFYGLRLKLREDAEVVYAPQLSNKHEAERFSETDENGLPVFDKKGDRAVYARKDGLARLYLYWDISLVSYYMGLAKSDPQGRIVVVNDGRRGEK